MTSNLEISNLKGLLIGNASNSKPKDYTRLIRQIIIRLATWRTKHSQFELSINLDTINSKRLVYQKTMMIMEMEKDWVHLGRNPETHVYTKSIKK
jgi:hypothetical protein